jgi:hypothetical protein
MDIPIQALKERGDPENGGWPAPNLENSGFEKNTSAR